MCRQWLPTSCLELREAISGFLRMQIELLFCAQIAPSCHRSEGSPPVEHLPLDVEGGAPGLELPDMGAQFGLALLVGVGKGAFVARISSLPRGSINVQTCNLLNVLHKQNCERFKIYSSNTPKLQHFMLKCRIRGVFLTSENCSSFKLLLLSIFFSNSQNSSFGTFSLVHFWSRK